MKTKHYSIDNEKLYVFNAVMRMRISYYFHTTKRLSWRVNNNWILAFYIGVRHELIKSKEKCVKPSVSIV